MNFAGFATPVAMGLALITALLATTALIDAGLARSLSTTRLLHQRAFAAGEIGLAEVATELALSGTPPPEPRRINLPGHPTDGVETAVSEMMTNPLPNGFSVGRVIERHFEVRSTGWSARNTRVTQVEGLHRRELAPPP